MFKTKHSDITLWIAFIALIGISAVALFSSSSTIIHKATAAGHNPLYPIAMQLLYLAAGVVLAWLLQKGQLWLFRAIGYFAFAVGLVCIFLNAIGIGVTLNDATRWIKVGGITIQSSEPAKLGLIVVVTHLLSSITDEASLRRNYIRILLLTGLTCGLIMISNLSTAILLGTIIVLLMIIARIPWKWWVGLIATMAVVLVIGFFAVKLIYVDQGREMKGPFKRAVTWVKRIDNKQTEKEDAATEYKLTDDNYQSMIAQVAVARGGQSPIGVLPGNSIERNYLPLANADYIFAIIVEETGIAGALVLIFIYLMVLFRCSYASSRYEDYGSQLMMMGLGLMITVQALVSMAVAVGLGPVTGQPLPLISKGGTSALVTSVYFGIMMGISREQTARVAEQEETIKESMQDIPELKTQ